MATKMTSRDSELRHAVLWVAIANLGYFFVEFAVARHIGSVALFADSVDFLEDTAVNLLIFVALAWSARRRAIVGMLLAALLMLPVAAALWTAWQKLRSPVAPEALLLSAAGLGALVVNVGCALLLARYRNAGSSLSRAAFLSARNDAVANLAIIAAGIVTMWWVSGWPDLVVGAVIVAMNANAAREVWEQARREYGEHRA